MHQNVIIDTATVFMLVLQRFCCKFAEILSLYREKLASFLMRVRLDDGSYVMHEGGEVDIRFVVIINFFQS